MRHPCLRLRTFCWGVLLGLPGASPTWAASTPGDASTFTPLLPLPAPRIVAAATAYPDSHFVAAHLVDGDARTEYSSDGQGTNTFVEFDFDAPTRLAALRHQDRNDPATIDTSELSFHDADGKVLATVTVTHTNQRGGVTFLAWPTPLTTQRVRWHVTALGSPHPTVGGAELTFFTTGESEPAPRSLTVQAKPVPILARVNQGLRQPLHVTLNYPYAEPVEATVSIANAVQQTLTLRPGTQTLECQLPTVKEKTETTISVQIAGQTVAKQVFVRQPIRITEIYILPHSHVDIGYTALQTEVEQKQNENIDRALELIRATRDYPLGARFKWNVEVLWPVDNYLRAASPEQRAAFYEAVRTGRIGLDALYGNLLTGLCRPEELVRASSYATRLAKLFELPVKSAMISDVPGYTWSTVPALAQAGVRYFSFAPNYFDRMGATMVTWQNKPFWWHGPDGQTRLLCWCPPRGYALGHLLGDGEALTRFLPTYLSELEADGYPFDLTYVRWSVHGDNGPPDEKLANAVRDWNIRCASPRLTIGTTTEAFRALEERYGNDLPHYRGDYTPYWEDGAASSALETALNRASAERLVQAETIWAMRNPGEFPVEPFHQAWHNVLLYSEHTWGAHNSISQPDLPFVLDQWKVKQGFALEADRQSRALLGAALGSPTPPSPATPPASIDVFNTCSWERTDLVTLSPELSAAGNRVSDQEGKAVPSQRLSTGDLIFLAERVPALMAKRYRVEAGTAPAQGKVQAQAATLLHPDFVLRIDERTGAIASLQSRVAKADLVNAQAATALNDFFYLPGAKLENLQRNGPPRITVKENGPLLASLLIESDAPGCRKLIREIRVADGLDRVELINTVDKLPVREKEGLHFGFGFHVPDGTVRMDVGWAVVRPELDQLPAACKNWFSVQRWVDIANPKYGVTWATLDAPMLELGAITANLIGSQTDHRVWIQELPPSQTLYSWVMNNHWHTNYRAEQSGPALFRYFLRPHRGYDPLDAARFGIGASQPLVPAPAAGAISSKPPFTLSSDQVLVTAFKHSDHGTARIVRLFGASGQEEKVRLSWAGAKPRQVWLSDTSEAPLVKAPRSIEVPGWGIVTLRVEF